LDSTFFGATTLIDIFEECGSHPSRSGRRFISELIGFLVIAAEMRSTRPFKFGSTSTIGDRNPIETAWIVRYLASGTPEFANRDLRSRDRGCCFTRGTLFILQGSSCGCYQLKYLISPCINRGCISMRIPEVALTDREVFSELGETAAIVDNGWAIGELVSADPSILLSESLQRLCHGLNAACGLGMRLPITGDLVP
jgi:hypothetical protein